MRSSMSRRGRDNQDLSCPRSVGPVLIGVLAGLPHVTDFAVCAPQRQRVRVLVDGTPHDMYSDATGWWRAAVDDAAPGTAWLPLSQPPNATRVTLGQLPHAIGGTEPHGTPTALANLRRAEHTAAQRGYLHP
jgi:hypothetical protein